MVYFPSFPNLYIYIFNLLFCLSIHFCAWSFKRLHFFPCNFLYRFIIIIIWHILNALKLPCKILPTWKKVFPKLCTNLVHKVWSWTIPIHLLEVCRDWVRTKLFLPSLLGQICQRESVVIYHQLLRNEILQNKCMFYHLPPALRNLINPIPMFSPWGSLDPPHWRHQRDVVQLCDLLWKDIVLQVTSMPLLLQQCSHWPSSHSPDCWRGILPSGF